MVISENIGLPELELKREVEKEASLYFYLLFLSLPLNPLKSRHLRLMELRINVCACLALCSAVINVGMCFDRKAFRKEEIHSDLISAS